MYLIVLFAGKYLIFQRAGSQHNWDALATKNQICTGPFTNSNPLCYISCRPLQESPSLPVLISSTFQIQIVKYAKYSMPMAHKNTNI